jgi:hypothetical protein
MKAFSFVLNPPHHLFSFLAASSAHTAELSFNFPFRTPCLPPSNLQKKENTAFLELTSLNSVPVFGKILPYYPAALLEKKP